jgi:hypothetical protein
VGFERIVQFYAAAEGRTADARVTAAKVAKAPKVSKTAKAIKAPAAL